MYVGNFWQSAAAGYWLLSLSCSSSYCKDEEGALNKKEFRRKLEELDRRLEEEGRSKYHAASKGPDSTDTQASPPLVPRQTKWKPWHFIGLGLILTVVVAVGNQFFQAIKELNSEVQASSNASAQQSETRQLEALYFGQGYVPLFVGRSVESAMVLSNEQFDESFWRIRNLDTNGDITTSYREGRPIEKVEGLFVCSQTLAPGADIPDFAIGQITLEVSKSCSGSVPPFVMGPVAEAGGVFVPTPLGENCYRADRCEAEVVEGVFLGFLDEEYNGYKRAIVETGVGKMEVELAWVEPVGREWCDISKENSDQLFAGAIEVRNSLFQVGALVRLVKSSGWDDSAFFHRLSASGEMIDGDAPLNSINEMLVKSGYWIPAVSEHPWEKILYTYNDDLLNSTWTSVFSDERAWDMPILALYAAKLNEAANSAFADPNPPLRSCLEEKSDQVAFLVSEKEDEDRRDEKNRDRWAADVEAVWRSIFCPTRSDQYPERCSSYDPAKDDLVGTGNGAGSNGGSSGGPSWGNPGGGANCTWVNGYTRRDGTRVSGYRRCG